MTKEFRNFLKQNDLYDSYIKNNKGESENPYTYFDSFHWASTDEGYDYWCYWESVWYDKLVEES